MNAKLLVETIRAVAGINVSSKRERKTGCRVTQVRIGPQVEVATRDGWICFWVAGREVRIGPVTPEQAESLVEDLEYDAVA
jgi:hypothetical protein